MSKELLDQYTVEIKKDSNKTCSITPRFLIEAFGWSRRSSNCQYDVETYLKENQLEVEPSYLDVWIDSEILLKHKKKATTKLTDPIKKIKILEAANNKPIIVKNDSSLKEAITKMMLHNFSQLPVVSGGKSICGYISWETIGTALANGVKSDTVKDYMNKNIQILEPDTPLLIAIKLIYDSDFVVVQAVDKTINGIVTTTDISSQFLTMTEPFLLLEQIENHIRQLLDNKFLVEDLEQLCSGDSSRTVATIDDLNFGDYIHLIENEQNWEKLNLSLDRVIFISQLDNVRQIRNDIMHFDPEGITPPNLKELQSMSRLLEELTKFKHT